MERNNNNTFVTFTEAKRPRNELELPDLYFVTVDQWLDVIGDRAFISWLKMYSWCKRDVATEDPKTLWEQAKIPTSFNKMIKKLKVGRDTFYNQILKPLWNAGLIDIEEYEDSENKGQKPMNIIVYKYPQNNKNLAYQPLQFIRNYETDYHSTARTFAKTGGRPKKELVEMTPGSEIEHPQITPVPFENGGGSEAEQGAFSNGTPPCSEIVPNNILNNSSNLFNSLNNSSNNLNNNSNSLSLSKELPNILTLYLESEIFKNREREIEGLQIFDIVKRYETLKEVMSVNKFIAVLEYLTLNNDKVLNFTTLFRLCQDKLEKDIQKKKRMVTDSELLPKWFDQLQQEQYSLSPEAQARQNEYMKKMLAMLEG